MNMTKALCLVFGLMYGALAFAGDIDSDNSEQYESPGITDYNPGFYLGAQGAMAKSHYSNSSYLISGNEYDSGYKLSGRGCLGYSFSQFIAAEFGYNYYGKPKFKNSSARQDILQHGIDLGLRASLPLDYGISLYVKGGFALIYRSALHSEGGFANKEANKRLTPQITAGINYWFVSNIALDLSYTRTLQVSDLPGIDFFAIGFIYRINI